MKKFTDPQEYMDKMDFFTHQNKDAIKNCYYMFDEVTRLINSRRLFYEMTDDALLIFRDEDSFYHVSFIVAKDSNTRISADKLCTTGIINRGDVKSEKLIQTEEAAKKLGFTFCHCNRKYSVDVEAVLVKRKEEYLALDKQLKEQGFGLIYYDDTHFDAVSELWDTYLVPENLSADDRKDNIKQTILVCNSKNQDYCGVVTPKFHGNDNICHLVVNLDYWDKNLSFYLYYHALLILSKHGFKQARTWVADDNVFSLRFQKKYFDILDTGLKSYSYSL